MSDIGLSLLQHRVLEILGDARDQEARLAKEMKAAGKPALPPFFFTADEVAEIRAGHAEEIARLTPKRELSAWEEDQLAQRQAKAAPQSTTDARSLFDMLSAALRDRRVTAELFVELARPLCLLGRSRTPPDAARAHAIATWLDMNVVAFGGQSKPAADPPPTTVKNPKVVELPRDKTARAIIAAGAKRRSEGDKL